jgi:translation initiation factor 4B
MSDWTRRGPLPDLPGQRRTSDRGGFGSSERGGGYRGFEAASDAGSERGERRRPPPFADDGKVRDFGNWERKGPLSPVPSAGPGPLREGGRMRSNDGPPQERRRSPGWGEGRSSDGSRPPRREFQERPQVEREPTAPELDNQWRTKMRPDAAAKSPLGTPDGSVPSSPAPTHAAPASRPRLNLAKRTVTEDAGSAATPESSSKSNPFGAARPIDTAAREKEIEEKRTLAIRQKKEADDKAREEKRAKEAADRADRKESVPATPTVEEGEEKPRTNFEILRRMGEEGDAPQDDAPDASANGEIVDDQAVKPKEVVRDPPKSEGAWRRKSNTPAAPAETTTTEELDADGWSTVTKPVKTTKGKGRGGAPSGPTRPIAS